LAPIPQLQSDTFSGDVDQARQILSVLAAHKHEIPNQSVKNAALLSFASEDYGLASTLVQRGLLSSPSDPALLAVRGLIEYETSSYRRASESFAKAQLAPGASPGLKAALDTNRGLTYWTVGEAQGAADSLETSTSVFGEMKKRRQQVYSLLLTARLYSDMGQIDRALKATNDALRQSLGVESVDAGRAYRGKANVEFLRGDTEAAGQHVEKAISTHRAASGSLDLAEDLDLKADIQEQQGHSEDALVSLSEASSYYASLRYRKGQASNQVKQAHVLALMGLYKQAENLINMADQGFTALGYDRGKGEAESERGALILRRASHSYLQGGDVHKGDVKWARGEALAAGQHFDKALEFFRNIGYQRGIVDAKLGLCQGLTAIAPVELLTQATAACQEAARVYEKLEYPRGKGDAYRWLGNTLRIQKNYPAAIARLNEAIAIHQRVDYKLGTGRGLLSLGRCYLEKGNRQAARDYFLSARKIFLDIGARYELTGVEGFLKQLGM
jgi:tetratricopeptide (TPR) repeat protein